MAVKKSVTKKTAKPSTKKTTKKTVTKRVTKKSPKSLRTKLICISHKEDNDGISSAALIRQAFGGDAILVDYPGQMDAIRQVATDEKLKTLIL